MSVDKKAHLTEWLQRGICTMREDGSIEGPFDIWISAKEAAEILGASHPRTITINSIRVRVEAGGNVQLSTVHTGGFVRGVYGWRVVERNDVDDLIAALIQVRENGWLK